jgi:hypothetical protein
MNARGSEIDCMRREKSMGIWKGGRARGCCKLLVMRASSVLTRLMGGWCTTLISDQFLLDFLLGVFGA